MSDQKERSVEGVLQEMQRVGEAVDIARRVVVVGAGHRSLLAAELGTKLAHLGLKVELVEPSVGVPSEQEEAKGSLYKSFADVLACPSLAPLFGEPEKPQASPAMASLLEKSLDGRWLPPHLEHCRTPAPAPVTAEAPEVMPDDDAALGDEPAPNAPDPEPVEEPPATPAIPFREVLMGYPETWKVGDIFEDHPRYTLLHKVRKWVLVAFDDTDVELQSPSWSRRPCSGSATSSTPGRKVSPNKPGAPIDNTHLNQSARRQQAMTQQFVTTPQIVTACEQEKDGQAGYSVKSADGVAVWKSKEEFEAQHIALGHIGHMPPFQQRVLGERAQLAVNHAALTAFSKSEAFKAVPDAEQARLLLQADAQGVLHGILLERIGAF